MQGERIEPTESDVREAAICAAIELSERVVSKLYGDADVRPDGRGGFHVVSRRVAPEDGRSARSVTREEAEGVARARIAAEQGASEAPRVSTTADRAARCVCGHSRGNHHERRVCGELNCGSGDRCYVDDCACTSFSATDGEIVALRQIVEAVTQTTEIAQREAATATGVARKIHEQYADVLAGDLERVAYDRNEPAQTASAAPREMPPDVREKIRQARLCANIYRVSGTPPMEGEQAVDDVCDALEVLYTAPAARETRDLTDDEAWRAFYKMRDVFEAWQAEKGPSELDARKRIGDLFRELLGSEGGAT